MHPDDVPRFAALGVAANMQPLWAAHEPQMVELTLPFLGPTRTAWQYPFGDLLRAGAGSPPAATGRSARPNPLAGDPRGGEPRAAPDDDAEAEPFLPEQAIDLETRSTAFTAGSAWVNHLDDLTGTIEVGKLADLVVLDRDPFAGPPEEIASTRVTQTFVEGERVYAA